ncbi:PREDICTED: galactokinase-like [Nicrophorus vespilloides]|uniref:Galactokinase-like n=1 Tax=Nicrophorus vespilloides TaxID=110193 RepID=A0ABM1MBS2_NICVS|nr:PREDICTED: galactokinase-like [Nicrophorus vespilloides]
MAEQIPSLESLIAAAKSGFREEFDGEDPSAVVFAPGRVNLIGEHTDYNDGFVLPMALPLVTVMVGSRTEGDESIVVTRNEDIKGARRVKIQKKELFTVDRRCEPKWANYVKGVLANYIGETPTFKAVIVSSVPIGGGLSSSAALEVVTYQFLDALNGDKSRSVMPTDKALACQKAEHDYAGMPCGIMDQFISFLGKKDCALLIDCRMMTSKLIPFADDNVVVLVTNSNVKHELTGSEYSTRRKQCEKAALQLKKLSLRDVAVEDVKRLEDVAEEDIVKRARHVVTEIARTKDAADALKVKDFVRFGELMTQSHKSLKDDFEVSCKELDELVDIALSVKGVLGSRMTGGGFGGCTVTLVYRNSVDLLIATIKTEYSGIPTFYVCSPSDGAQIIH